MCCSASCVLCDLLLCDVPLDVVDVAEPVVLEPVVGAGELDVGGCWPGTVAAVPAMALVQAVKVTADSRTASARRYRTADVAAGLTQAPYCAKVASRRQRRDDGGRHRRKAGGDADRLERGVAPA